MHREAVEVATGSSVKCLKAIVPLVFLLMTPASPVSGKAAPDVLTSHLVKELALRALRPAELRLPALGVDFAETSGRYVYVTVTWRGAAGGSAVVENFAIDRFTGDVFTSSACDERKNPRLERFQVQVRRTLGLSRAQYKKLKTQGPFCH